MRVCPEAQMLDYNLFLPDTFDADIVVDSNDWLRPAHIVREIQHRQAEIKVAKKIAACKRDCIVHTFV